MIRLSTLFWLILMSATGFAMFAVKYEVQALADQLAQTTRQAGQADHELRVLDAEWAYLNRPEALAQMNQRYLSLAPIATKQLHTSVADIPMRVLPTAPVETVAAVAGIAAPAAPAAMQRSASSASQPATNQVPQPSSPAQTATPVVTAALDTPVALPEPARPASPLRPRPIRRAKSLDALIALIAENR
jgi:hypothetical protein